MNVEIEEFLCCFAFYYLTLLLLSMKDIDIAVVTLGVSVLSCGTLMQHYRVSIFNCLCVYYSMRFSLYLLQ